MEKKQRRMECIFTKLVKQMGEIGSTNNGLSIIHEHVWSIFYLFQFALPKQQLQNSGFLEIENQRYFWVKFTRDTALQANEQGKQVRNVRRVKRLQLQDTERFFSTSGIFVITIVLVSSNSTSYTTYIYVYTYVYAHMLFGKVYVLVNGMHSEQSQQTRQINVK
ncbi:hypothetical protein RFI_24374 [Reticulomyxa filosa]|uniref:Uncharacterized protein n=1 Tax=Reticulomyxa filosa TaxID=46433 RepID=X6MH67_RETFI|nr:hypothetical protein RFI_24374 [Reticulomyxa filosa]|eukprot:ETO13001.1 hypothetical protein RFI_24374 [Reticulomyxa filosa]